MTLGQPGRLDAQRNTALAYVDGLSDADLEQRKARVRGPDREDPEGRRPARGQIDSSGQTNLQ